MNEQDIFLSALQLESNEERQAFIKERCGADDELRKRLEALLQAHAETGNFLANPAIGSVSIRAQITEDAGTIVGPYKLLQRIGEGGFGVVYMAEQAEPVRRKVALKIIKPGMDTKDVIARFESERQALALMDHPNIARVLDAGATNSGRPYFVMELVKGVPITDFCDKNHLSVEDRMHLFIPVCLAVQHAHHKGIIHRDIKPSNVMVTLHDGKPVPKVIDFGVAKATSQQLTQKTLFTAYGQMIGTPLYMSPEQAEMSGLDIDTRSDIYSLGVLLYELLTGTTPIEQKRLREAGFAEMQRLIRDIEAPRPSTRLSSLHNDASVLISTNRGTDAKRLSDLLRGDVDWIVMKALEKDRQRRYDTPNALADDIQRFLKHEAIIARPPSTAYRVQKFIQRNKGLAFAAASITSALLLGAVVSTGFALYANSQLDRAVAAESRLQGSLTDAQQERKKAIEERDRAVKAEAAQEELTQQAEQSRKEADAARMAELQQRQEAERQRDDAQRLKDEAIALTTQLKIPTRSSVDPCMHPT
jgi:eukaryotic-like serine/threonine-protein kinase